MRKLVATACFALIGAGAFAQTAAGTRTLGGSVRVSSQGTDNQNSKGNVTNFFLAPSTGYFYKDRLEVGIGTYIGYGRHKNADENGTNVSKNLTTGISSFVTQYIPITEKLHFTATGNIGISLSRNKMKYAPADSFQDISRTFGYGIVALPGLTYFATEKIGFSINIGAIVLERRKTTYESSGAPSTATNTATFLSASISPVNSSIGMRYYFVR